MPQLPVMWEPIVWRIVRRYAAAKGQPMPAAEFTVEFFKRHSVLHRFAPKKIIAVEKAGAGAHPEARQIGEEIQLYPKFWALDGQTRDFVFAHEIGHYVLSRHGLSKLIEALNKQGVDPWDTSALPFGQGNMDEAFADSFATYFLDRSELKNRYPQWDAVVHATVG